MPKEERKGEGGKEKDIKRGREKKMDYIHRQAETELLIREYKTSEERERERE